MSAQSRVFLALAGVLLLGMPVFAQISVTTMAATNGQVATATRDAAAKALADLVAPDRKHTFQALEGTADVSKAKLGPAIPVYFVRLDKLKAYERGSDPLQLLSRPTIVVYPVLVDKSGASSIEVSQASEGAVWKVSAVGRASFAKALTDVRPQLADAPSGTARNISVWVPAMNQRFLGDLVGNALQLTPLIDEPRFGFKRGVMLGAAAVFEKLQPAALKMTVDAPGN